MRKWLCRLWLALCMSAVATLTYFLLDREPPYIFYDGVMMPHVVASGEKGTVRWRVKINRECTRGTVDRRIVDSTTKIHTYLQAEARKPRKMGPDEFLYRDIITPKAAMPGPATYSVEACYECNILQRFIWPVCYRTMEVPFVMWDNPNSEWRQKAWGTQSGEKMMPQLGSELSPAPSP